MSLYPTNAEWAADRGDKWRANLAGMEPMLQPVDEPLVAALQLDAPYRIADVACGGGLTTLEILRRAPAGSVVHGFDISPGLIEVARGRAPADARGLAFDVADIATATPAQPFDRLCSRFGIMFFADPPGAFANLARWLAPGGRFAFAVWGDVAGNPWMTIVRDVVVGIVELPPPDPDAPGAFRYADADKLRALLDRAGFADLAVQDWRGALRVGGGLAPAEAASFALTAFAAFGELLARAGDAAVAEARRALTARLAEHVRDGVVLLDAHIRIFTGRR